MAKTAALLCLKHNYGPIQEWTDCNMCYVEFTNSRFSETKAFAQHYKNRWLAIHVPSNVAHLIREARAKV